MKRRAVALYMRDLTPSQPLLLLTLRVIKQRATVTLCAASFCSHAT